MVKETQDQRDYLNVLLLQSMNANMEVERVSCKKFPINQKQNNLKEAILNSE